LRVAAINALSGMDPKPKECIAALSQTLKDNDVSVRLAAAGVLATLEGSDSAPAVAVMREAVTSTDANIRRDAASALGECGAKAKSALSVLKKAAGDENATVRNAAALAIARIKTAQANHAAVRILLKGLKEKDAPARQDAARLLGQIGPEARSAIPALSHAVQDESEEVRKAASDALTKIQNK
jgi:HEAT repeat protein